MTIPAVLFGFLISTLYAVIFHLWRGGGPGRIIYYLILSWIGFWAGQVFATSMEWSLIKVGPLHLGFNTLTSWVILLIGYWLSPGKQNHKLNILNK